ncbi:glutathione S-transferase [Lineolata rhizophorae]|uniref:Glutathione S-transferase n=1 Tax=Lineolata rhizophorae TaxID=578093 RepID=A0A6A6NVI6_9PEZI|nr:glutathione S-transferase [Lineolata rhizophorae]
MSAPDITLYTGQTPNGIKVSIALEELGLPYKVVKVDISKGTQKEPWFLAINPNGRIPAITDTFTDGQPIRVFESGSILQYLAERYDAEHKVSFPPGSREHVEMTNWLFYQMAGLGPMQGQANHFFRYAPETIEYGVNRYQNESRRLYRVLDEHLAEGNKTYLVGEKCTIADISCYGWIAAAGWAGIDIDEFPTLKKWEERMEAREGVRKGSNVPDPFKVKELVKNKAKAEAHAKAGSAWVQQGMKENAQKKL